MLTLGLVCGLALGACDDDATRSEINARAGEDAGRDAAAAHQADSGAAVDAGGVGNTDEPDARASVDVDSGARLDAGDDSGPTPVADSSIAVIESGVCNSGYEDDGKGACINIDDCQGNTCGVSGACIDGVNAYTCNCPAGYSGIGTMMCTDIDECEGSNVCSSDYPCANTVPDYYCRGQFAEWPMPDHVAGAQTAPSYAADAETVTDNVTHLVWQKGAPATYPACSGNDAMSGDTCTWEEAKAYCSSQELAISLGGTGWRLPTKIELESLVDRTRSNPAIDPVFAMPASFRIYWTASPHLAVSGNAYFVDFSGGASSSFPATTTYRVRCVR